MEISARKKAWKGKAQNLDRGSRRGIPLSALQGLHAHGFLLGSGNPRLQRVRADVGDDDVEQEPAREQAGDGVRDHLGRCERYRVEDAEEVRLVTQHLMTFGAHSGVEMICARMVARRLTDV